MAAWVATGIKVGSIVTPSKYPSYPQPIKMNVHLRGSFIRETLARVIGHFASTSNSIAAAISPHNGQPDTLVF